MGWAADHKHIYKLVWWPNPLELETSYKRYLNNS